LGEGFFQVLGVLGKLCAMLALSLSLATAAFVQLDDEIPVRRKKAMSARDVYSLSLTYLRRKTKCREVLAARKQKCDMHLKFCFWSCKVSPQMANYTTLLFSLCKHKSNGTLVGAWCYS
jgi:hypothetical protein